MCDHRRTDEQREILTGVRIIIHTSGNWNLCSPILIIAVTAISFWLSVVVSAAFFDRAFSWGLSLSARLTAFCSIVSLDLGLISATVVGGTGARGRRAVVPFGEVGMVGILVVAATVSVLPAVAFPRSCLNMWMRIIGLQILLR